MTVQVMSGTAAAEAPAAGIIDKKIEKPYVYSPPEAAYSAPVRQFAPSRRKAGFGGVLALQLTLSAVLGAGLWAGSVFGDDGVRAVCEEISALFR